MPNTPAISNALFALAFRPFFLLAALFGVILMLLWGLALSGWDGYAPYGGIQFWHGHEMLFGFVGAVLVGFLLTAVQNWTGLPAVNGKPLMTLVLLWLLGRFLMAVPVVPDIVIIFIDLLFFPAAAIFLFIPLLVRSQARNYFAVLVLFLLMFCNGISHYSVLNNQLQLQQQVLFSTALLITVMMAIIGGRIIPMFTANTTAIPAKDRQVWPDRIALGALWLLLFMSLLMFSMPVPAILLSIMAFLSALMLALRSSRWHFSHTLSHPLLWSLHLGYLWIVIGLLLYAASQAGFAIPETIALHSLTAGAMGMLIISMMSRVSLGHTGRPIVSSRLITLSFYLVMAAAIVRVFGVWLLPAHSSIWLMLSVLFWCIAFMMFLIRFLQVLTQPRADGKPG